MEKNDFFTQLNKTDFDQLFSMDEFNAFEGMNFPSLESVEKEFKNETKFNDKSKAKESKDADSFNMPDFSDFEFDTNNLFDFSIDSFKPVEFEKPSGMPSSSADFDFGFDLTKLEQEFDKQFTKESVSSGSKTLGKIFDQFEEKQRSFAEREIAKAEKIKAIAKKKIEKAKAAELRKLDRKKLAEARKQERIYLAKKKKLEAYRIAKEKQAEADRLYELRCIEAEKRAARRAKKAAIRKEQAAQNRAEFKASYKAAAQILKESYYSALDKIQRSIDERETKKIEVATKRYYEQKRIRYEKAKLCEIEAVPEELKQETKNEEAAKEPKAVIVVTNKVIIEESKPAAEPEPAAEQVPVTQPIEDPVVKEKPLAKEKPLVAKPSTDFAKLAKERFSNAYYTWAIVWDQLDEERELRKIDKLSEKHNREYLQ